MIRSARVFCNKREFMDRENFSVRYYFAECNLLCRCSKRHRREKIGR